MFIHSQHLAPIVSLDTEAKNLKTTSVYTSKVEFLG